MKYYKKDRYGNVLGKDKILLFGNDAVTSRILGKLFTKSVFTSNSVYSNFKNIIWENNPNLIILNYGSEIPLKINFGLCRQLKTDRRLLHIPVIILGDCSSNDCVIKALESGAEDYLVKPLNAKLFQARVNVILRRRFFQEEPEEIIRIRQIILNLTNHTVTINNNPVNLAPKEFALLYFLMKRKGQVLSRKALMENVWEKKYFPNMRTINAHVQNLRKKLGSSGDNIEAVEGIGYRFNT